MKPVLNINNISAIGQIKNHLKPDGILVRRQNTGLYIDWSGLVHTSALKGKTPTTGFRESGHRNDMVTGKTGERENISAV